MNTATEVDDTPQQQNPAQPPPEAAQPTPASPQATAPATSTPAQPDVQRAAPGEQAAQIPLEQQKADSWGSKVYHGILNALGGSSDVTLARDPATGKMVATAVKSGPGQQWKRIISGALAGYGAAAAGGGTGPGSTSRKIGLGIQAGTQQGEQNVQRQRQQANEDFEMQQKAATSNAQNALLSHQIAESAFRLGRAQVEATVADSERETNFTKMIAEGGEGSQDMGVFPDFPSVIKTFKDMPQLHDHQANGQLIAIPHVDGNGKVDGIHAALVTPDWLSSKITKDIPITVKSIKDGKLNEETFTIPSGSISNDQASKLLMGQSKDALDEFHKAEDQRREASRTKAENTLSYAQAREADANAAAAGTGGGGTSEADDISEGLASGRYLAGKDIPLRTTKGQPSAAHYAAAADAYSRAHFGLPYSPEIIRQESHFAEAPKTQAFLIGIDRMLGAPGVPSQLDLVTDLAKRAGLGDNAPINEVKLWAKRTLGLEAAKNFDQALSDTQTALGTLIGNPLLGSGESDLKLKTAQRQFGSNPTIKDLRGAVQTTREILNGARSAMARNNRYIQQRYGEEYSPAKPLTPAGGPAPVKITPGEPTAIAADGKTTLVVRGGQWVPAQP
ncbi:MAG TPA: hypothetical protein VL498_06980 [Terracidiphilus sp.]|nr:hypothetical protein [Terracidiphilus sp.]